MVHESKRPIVQGSSEVVIARSAERGAGSRKNCITPRSRLHAPRLLVQPAHLVAQLLTIVVEEGVGDRLQIAGDYLVKVVHREANAVVGQAILRKVVRTNSLAAVAGTDETFAFGGSLGLLFLHFEIVNAGSQFAERFVFVFELALF